jgi:hypothetical protein
MTETNQVAAAMQTISDAMRADPDYAWTWHCNVAMAARDAGAPSPEAQAQAAQFMRNAFGVDTSQMAIGYGLDVAPVRPICGDHAAALLEAGGAVEA